MLAKIQGKGARHTPLPHLRRQPSSCMEPCLPSESSTGKQRNRVPDYMGGKAAKDVCTPSSIRHLYVEPTAQDSSSRSLAFTVSRRNRISATHYDNPSSSCPTNPYSFSFTHYPLLTITRATDTSHGISTRATSKNSYHKGPSRFWEGPCAEHRKTSRRDTWHQRQEGESGEGSGTSNISGGLPLSSRHDPKNSQSLDQHTSNHGQSFPPPSPSIGAANNLQSRVLASLREN